jgi:outer membrane protein
MVGQLTHFKLEPRRPANVMRKVFALSLLQVVALLGASSYCAAQSAPQAAAVAAPAPPRPLVAAQTPPQLTVARTQFERNTSAASLPNLLYRQWSPASEVPPESVISERYLKTFDRTAQHLGLKQVIYLALSNNPSVKAVELSPVNAIEAVKSQTGVFDPDLLATLDQIKNVIPITTPLETSQGHALSTKLYDWNFALNKILASTNGTLSLTFNNERTITNNLTQTVNPGYVPTLAVSLSQPLLRNFGWKFATINVQLAESSEKQSQWNMAQQLSNFVQQVAADYWGVAEAEENLEVARAALNFNRDLVRQNTIAVKVGTLAPLDLREAQSSAATAEANFYTAEANLKNARVALRQDVMLNPAHSFLPQSIEPADQPNAEEPVNLDDKRAVRLMVEYLPSLGGLREAIRTTMIQTRFQENQLLPQLNVQAQMALTSLAGSTLCGPAFSATPNCVTSSGGPGSRLSFDGSYGTALNRLMDFGLYNYALILSYERPVSNASARAALAQSRVGYEQARLQYDAALSQAVVALQSALAAAEADIQRVRATKAAAGYAQQALHDEQVRFRVGMATTHDLLQFESELVSAQGEEVAAATDLENAKVALRNAEGVLLTDFGVHFQLTGPEPRPWFAQF